MWPQGPMYGSMQGQPPLAMVPLSYAPFRSPMFMMAPAVPPPTAPVQFPVYNQLPDSASDIGRVLQNIVSPTHEEAIPLLQTHFSAAAIKKFTKPVSVSDLARWLHKELLRIQTSLLQGEVVRFEFDTDNPRRDESLVVCAIVNGIRWTVFETAAWEQQMSSSSRDSRNSSRSSGAEIRFTNCPYASAVRRPATLAPQLPSSLYSSALDPPLAADSAEALSYPVQLDWTRIDFGEQRLSSARVSALLRPVHVKNTSNTAVVYFLGVHIQPEPSSSCSYFTMNDDHDLLLDGVQLPATVVKLEPGTVYPLVFELTAAEDTNRPRIPVLRQWAIFVFATTSSTNNSAAPTEPTASTAGDGRRLRLFCHVRRLQAVVSVSPPSHRDDSAPDSDRAFKQFLTTAPAFVPDALRQLFTTAPEHVSSVTVPVPRYAQSVTSNCATLNRIASASQDSKAAKHLRKLERLVLLEARCMAEDMRIYDMFDTQLTRIGADRYRFRASGVMEDRPALYYNDRVRILFPDRPHTAFDARIADVSQDSITVTVPLDFPAPLHPTVTVHLGFFPNLQVFDSILDAIQYQYQAGSHQFPFFPTSSHLPSASTSSSSSSRSHSHSHSHRRHSRQSMQWYHQNINTEQMEAVVRIVNGDSGPAPFLIYGPPGTGKTVTVTEAVLQVLRASEKQTDEQFPPLPSTRHHSVPLQPIGMPGHHILVCAPSISAVDTVCLRLAPFLSPDEMIVVNDYRRAPNTAARIISYCTVPTAEGWFPLPTSLARYKVILCTVASASLLSRVPQFDPSLISHIFIDECVQATEPELLIPLRYYTAQTQVVLAGDPNQLSPVVHSGTARRYGLDKSLMERLLCDCPLYASLSGISSLPYDQCMIKLVRNYRSQPEILRLYSDWFYDGELVSTQLQSPAELVQNLSLSSSSSTDSTDSTDFPFHLPTNLVYFWGVVGEQDRRRDSSSIFNEKEARVLCDVAQQIVARMKDTSVLGIISPFRRQVQLIRTILRNRGLGAVRVGTIDDYQGQEETVVLISTCVSDADVFADDNEMRSIVDHRKRINVAISRAKSLLCVFGHPYALLRSHWNKYIQICRDSRSCLGTVVNDDDTSRAVTDLWRDPSSSRDYYAASDSIWRLSL